MFIQYVSLSLSHMEAVSQLKRTYICLYHIYIDLAQPQTRKKLFLLAGGLCNVILIEITCYPPSTSTPLTDLLPARPPPPPSLLHYKDLDYQLSPSPLEICVTF